jgi:polysaccharide pyruvyl transferase WcaK-like protein
MIILGYFGHSNCGDEAFKLAYKYLASASAKLDFCNPNSIQIQSLSQSDHIILGGGNVIDPYFLKNLPIGISLSLIGVGLNSAKGLEELSKFTIQNCLVRNKIELEIFKEKFPQAMYIPDLVFSIASQVNLSTERNEQQVKSKSNKKKLGIVLSDRLIGAIINTEELSLNRGLACISALRGLISIISYLSNYYSLNFISFSSDTRHRDDLFSRLILSTVSPDPSKATFHDVSNDPNLGIETIGSMDLVISFKFHALVFCMLKGTPFVNLSDAVKCTDLLDSMGLSHLSHDLFASPFDRSGLEKAIKSAESTSRESLVEISQELGLLVDVMVRPIISSLVG